MNKDDMKQRIREMTDPETATEGDVINAILQSVSFIPGLIALRSGLASIQRDVTATDDEKGVPLSEYLSEPVSTVSASVDHLIDVLAERLAKVDPEKVAESCNCLGCQRRRRAVSADYN